jgi:hypothetical protein
VVSFGNEITCTFTVDSATTITANISIDDAATLGVRNISVTTSYVTGTLTGGFTVNVAPVESDNGNDLWIILVAVFGGLAVILAIGSVAIIKRRRSA